VAGPLLPIEPPAFTPARYGLLSVAPPTTPADPHWAGGVQYQALCPSGGTTYDECIVVTGSGGPPPPPTAKADNVDWTARGATPFTVYAEFDCAPAAFANEAEAQRLAEDALTRVEGWQVERAFWTGQAVGQRVVFPHLAEDEVITADDGINGSPVTITLNTAAVVITGGGPGPTDVVQGLGVLEQALADCYKGEGVIHITTALLPSLVAHGLVYRDGAQLRTWKGNLVAVGGGYTGSSPAGAIEAAPGTWIYATGSVFAYRSAIQTFRLAETLDRNENTIRAIAERTYVLGWDCCHLATLVTAGGVVAGSSGAGAAS
jgi:hypothetical protein